ncbi:MAG: DUF2783 domain-containing protein [Burkholderiaceae bacterium]
MNEQDASRPESSDNAATSAASSAGGLGPAKLEAAYEMIAGAIDRAGPGNEALFLAKLGLVLAHQAGDLDLLARSLAIAGQDLPERIP